MKSKSILLLSTVLLFAFYACKKEPGEGGKASVTGKVLVKDYNTSFTQLIGEYYAPAEDVYIIYGDHEIYDDDMKTNHDGSFKFNYLQEGKYTIFVYSKDSTGQIASGVEPVFVEFEITDKKEDVVLEDIIILN